MKEPRWYVWILMIPIAIIRSPYIIIEGISFVKDIGLYLLKRK